VGAVTVHRMLNALQLGPTENASMEQLLQEYRTHRALAQLYYRRALEAKEQGGCGTQELRDKAQLYLQAANLCLGEILLRTLAAGGGEP